ncbi:hypothetical protein [Pyrodictium abyssi]|uniref:hypothetical protein n=1 Tax=Pyrodictium abyssi TaxID=54256 RepID=UPI0030C6A8EF
MREYWRKVEGISPIQLLLITVIGGLVGLALGIIVGTLLFAPEEQSQPHPLASDAVPPSPELLATVTPAKMPPPIPRYICLGFGNGTTVCYVEGPGIIPNITG